MKNSMTANRVFHIVECIWSFCIPCAVIVIMDTSVVLESTSFRWFRVKKGELKRRKSALEEIIKLTRSNSGRMKARQQRALCRWLLIALICVLLNTPENTIRLISLFGIMEGFNTSPYYFIARMLAQVLYFSQFAFNAIYLALFVYDKSSRAKHVHDGSNYNSHAALPHPLRSRRGSTCCESPPLAPRTSPPMIPNGKLLHPQMSLTTSRSLLDPLFSSPEISSSDLADLAEREISHN
ncbi:unnamed protein product, partial [Mesorhabditis belari]